MATPTIAAITKTIESVLAGRSMVRSGQKATICNSYIGFVTDELREVFDVQMDALAVCHLTVDELAELTMLYIVDNVHARVAVIFMSKLYDYWLSDLGREQSFDSLAIGSCEKLELRNMIEEEFDGPGRITDAALSTMKTIGDIEEYIKQDPEMR